MSLRAIRGNNERDMDRDEVIVVEWRMFCCVRSNAAGYSPLNMRLPHSPQKWFVIVLPVAMVLVMANVLILSLPRTYLSDLSRMVKFEANMEAVSLRQSTQLHTNW